MYWQGDENRVGGRYVLTGGAPDSVRCSAPTWSLPAVAVMTHPVVRLAWSGGGGGGKGCVRIVGGGL